MPGIDIEHLYTAARQTIELLPRVQARIPELDTVIESQIGSQGRVSAAPTPWNDAYAFTAYGIRDDARRHESGLNLRLHHKTKFRPNTDPQIRECLSRLPVLIAHAREALPDADQDDVEAIARDLHRWPGTCRIVLEEPLPGDKPWTKAPGGLRCPYCNRPLQLAPGWESLRENTEVVCRHCRTDDGHPYTWPITERIGHLQADEYISEPVARHRYGLGSRLRVWHHRGRIHPYGRDDDGAKLYRVSDIVALLDQPEGATA